MFVDFFIRRPIFATVCALLIILAGAVTIPTLPVAQFPELAPPQVNVSRFLQRRERSNRRNSRHHAARAGDQRRRGHEVHDVVERERRLERHHGHLRHHAQPDLAAVDVQNRVNQALGRLPNEVKTIGISVTKSSSGFVFGAAVYCRTTGEYDAALLSNYIDVYVRDALKRVPGVADVHHLRRAKILDALVARSATAWPAAGSRPTDVVSALSEQNVQVAAGQVGQPPANAGRATRSAFARSGRLDRAGGVRKHHFEDGRGRRPGPLARTSAAPSSAPRTTAAICGSTAAMRSASASRNCRPQMRSPSTSDAKAELSASRSGFLPGMKYASAFDNTTVVDRIDQRGARTRCSRRSFSSSS